MTLVIEQLTKTFGGIVALQAIRLTAQRGEVVALIGPNGSGKTTVFNCITGIVGVDRGSISWKGADLTHAAIDARARFGIGRTFQELRVFGTLTALENVLLSISAMEESVSAAVLRMRTQKAEAQHIERALDALHAAGLQSMTNRLAGELSYGQRRLLDFSRVLVSGAELFLFDEPTAGVASALTPYVLSAIERLRADGHTVLFIEHNFDVLDVATRAVLLDAGRIVLDGPPTSVRRDPLTLQVYFGATS